MVTLLKKYLSHYSNLFFLLVTFSFAIFVAVWVYYYLNTEVGSDFYTYFTNTYGVFALIGGIWGVYVAQKWGGAKSLFGKTLLFLSFGLLLQEVGQLFYMYYIYVRGVEIPYPSLGDVGFFGSVVFYLVAAFYLFKMSNTAVYIRRFPLKSIVIALFVLLVFATSYNLIIQNRFPNFEDPLTSLLDFAYPVLQLLYVSMAVIVLGSSGYMLNGLLKLPFTVLLLALIAQYLSDSTFLYMSGLGTWVPGGVNDLMYLVSYYLMFVSIFMIDSVYKGYNRRT